MKNFLGAHICMEMQKRLMLEGVDAEPSNRNQSFHVNPEPSHIKMPIQCSAPLAGFNYRDVDVAEFPHEREIF